MGCFTLNHAVSLSVCATFTRGLAGQWKAEAFSALVANIYDAALDPPSWRYVLKDVCAFVRGGPSASLFWQDAVKRTGKTYYVWGGEARFNQLYWDKYVTLNPFTAAARPFPGRGGLQRR